MTKHRTRDVIDVRRRSSAIETMAAMTRGAHVQPVGRAKPMKPTAEQMRHGSFEEVDIVDKKAGGTNVTIGHAYRRQPRYVSIDGLGTAQMKALSFYRAVYDRSERSETRCALDARWGSSGAGAGIGALELTEGLAHARSLLASIESGIGANLDTLRAVALQDQTFSEVAMERYGSREVERVVAGKGRVPPAIVKTLAPRSGKHRTLVRDQFMTALARLVDAVEPYQQTASRGGLRGGTA
ncbi:hypothetical protein [Sphingomonas sanxanigenens]|uniref:Uncharacterized protein n=1 Tax=Sphingomonas sanxanigenens DSM 19645 = NX02 TaxID=1123269 RepID=W0ADB8_9SPHN|nr:hypothetical protein [Sphingomonas sanxanigenens]AHE55899.1 hypothetical protein NX02_21315 [Sphingomonas sanxanigenens DSM 19645 = NX02]